MLSRTLLLSDALDWEFGIGNTWSRGAFEGLTDLPIGKLMSGCCQFRSTSSWMTAGETATSVGLGESHLQGQRVR